MDYKITGNESYSYVSNYYSSAYTRAERLGINVENYYTYNTDGSISNINNAALNAAIKKAEEQEMEKQNEVDIYVKAGQLQDAQLTDEENAKANKYQDQIDKEYTEALNAYANAININAMSATENGLNSDWDALKTKTFKFTSVDATNTTILEGAKEIIAQICSLTKEIKSTTNKKKEEDKFSFMSIDTEREILDKENEIEVYTTFAEDNTNPFADLYLKSALETFDTESEEKAIA